MTKPKTSFRKQLQAISWVLKLMASLKLEFYLALLFTLFSALTSVLFPKFLGYFVDQYLSKVNQGFLPENFWKYLLLFSFTTFVNFVIKLLMQVVSVRVQTSINFKIQNTCYNYLMKAPFSYLDRVPSGKIVARIIDDAHRVSTFYDTFFRSIVFSALILLLMILVVVWTNPYYILFLLLPVLVVSLSLYFMNKLSGKIFAEQRRLNSEDITHVNESLQNLSIIQAFNAEHMNRNDYQNLQNTILRNEYKVAKYIFTTGYPLVIFLRNFTIFMILFFFALSQFDFLQSFMTVGSLFVLLQYLEQIFNLMHMLEGRIMEFQNSLQSIVHIQEFLKEDFETDPSLWKRYQETGEEKPSFTTDEPKLEPKNKMREEYKRAKCQEEYRPDPQALLEMRQVDFSYLPDVPVLKQISFSVYPKQTVAFVGKTGSGKSTIMNLFLAFYSYERGDIFLKGKSYKDLKLEEIRKNFTIVLQEPFLFKASLLENICLGNPDISEEQVLEALHLLGGDRILKKFPQGIHSLLSEGASELSSGERQLISFTRAFVFNPEILILDEATANMDTESEQLISQALNILSKNRTTLIIAHRLSTIVHADQIFVLQEGEIKERGRHEDLLARGGLYKNMVQGEAKERKRAW